MRIMGVVAVASAVGLAACAQGPGQGAAGSAVEHLPVAAPLPDAPLTPRQVGQEVTLQHADGSRTTWTVVAVEGGTTSAVSDRGEEAVEMTPFQAALAWSVTDSVGTAEIVGDPRALFTLRVGRQAEWIHRGVSNGEPFESRVRCTVADQVRIVVPARAFDTFKVDCIRGRELSDPFATATYYYAPAVGDVVRVRRSNRDRGLFSDSQVAAITGPALGAATD